MKALLIDYGSGNLRSAAKALEAAGFSVAVAQDPKAHEEADLLVLPGQGHFGQVMRAFQESGFVERVRRHLERGLPFLGICVGMQVLYEGSEEAPGVRGLGLVPGEVRRSRAFQPIWGTRPALKRRTSPGTRPSPLTPGASSLPS